MQEPMHLCSIPPTVIPPPSATQKPRAKKEDHLTTVPIPAHKKYVNNKVVRNFLKDVAGKTGDASL